MWADKVRYGFAGFRSTASPDRIAKSPVVDIAHARFRKNDCRVPQEKFRVQDSSSQRQASASMQPGSLQPWRQRAAMPDPMVGDRVQISGIGGRPQLNGMFGTVTGRAAAVYL